MYSRRFAIAVIGALCLMNLAALAVNLEDNEGTDVTQEIMAVVGAQNSVKAADEVADVLESAGNRVMSTAGVCASVGTLALLLQTAGLIISENRCCGVMKGICNTLGNIMYTASIGALLLGLIGAAGKGGSFIATKISDVRAANLQKKMAVLAGKASREKESAQRHLVVAKENIDG